MKRIFIISFLFCSITASTQDDPAVLSRQLTEHLTSDREKVTAIFKWITGNIDYAVRPSETNPLRPVFEEEESDGLLKSLNERVASIVLKRKFAVCDGYARLFTTLCDYAGIRSEIIVGYARANSNKPLAKFGVNHYWNAVYFEGYWHLLDATWASGYVARNGGMFIRDYDPFYFLTPPEQFIKDHYPDDIAWTLLPDSKVPEEFRDSPFKQASFIKYQITSYSPSKGIIDVFVGDTISLEIRSSLTGDRAISPSFVRNPDSISHSESVIFLKPDKIEMGLLMPKHCQYTFAVASDKIQWLYLIYNNDLVLRYRVNVKNKKS